MLHQSYYEKAISDIYPESSPFQFQSIISPPIHYRHGIVPFLLHVFQNCYIPLRSSFLRIPAPICPLFHRMSCILDFGSLLLLLSRLLVTIQIFPEVWCLNWTSYRILLDQLKSMGGLFFRKVYFCSTAEFSACLFSKSLRSWHAQLWSTTNPHLLYYGRSLMCIYTVNYAWPITEVSNCPYWITFYIFRLSSAIYQGYVGP